MDQRDWDPVYETILADMGYSREEDEASVRILKAVTLGSDLVDPDDLRPMFRGTATVLGAAARLEDDIAEHPPEGAVVCSGSAVGRAMAEGVMPVAVVTDLDGDIAPQMEASEAGAVTFIHAHGGNGDLVRAYAGRFAGPVVLTTQSRPEATVFDFGGFTDGDRAACISQALGSSRIVLLGFDFEHPFPKPGSDPDVKLRKLGWAREIIGMLDADIVLPRSGAGLQPRFIRSRHPARRGDPVSTAYLVLLILFIVYLPIWIWTWVRPEAAERWHLRHYGPCIMIRTRLGMRTMERLSRHTRFWRAFGFFEKVVSAVLFFLMMYMLIASAIALPRTLSSGSSIGIEYALAIPGFNPIMPLSYGIVALVVAMVVHELAHGIQSRANGIPVEASGLLYGVVPLGAFVEPSEEGLRKASRRAMTDVYAAGITVNAIVAVLSMILLMAACGSVGSDHSDNAGAYYIDDGSPAYDVGIPASALILAVAVYEDGSLSGYTDVTASLDGTAAVIDYPFDPVLMYSLRYDYRGDIVETGPVQMGAYVKTLSTGSAADEAGIEPGMFVRSIDGIAVHSPRDFTDYMRTTSPGQVVTVVTVSSDGDAVEVEHTATLTSSGSSGFLGIACTTGGMTLTTPDIILDAATDPFYGADSAYDHVRAFLGYLSGPFNGMDPISDEIEWWYDAPGDHVFWIIVRMLYWLFWLDILLAVSNALPTYILDGGFIFAGGVDWALEKTGIRDAKRRGELTESITGSVSTVTLFLFVLVIAAMVIRGGA